MSPIEPNAVPSTLTIPAGTVLEDAARSMTEAQVEEADIVDGSGERIGRLDMRRTISAMVAPSPHRAEAEPDHRSAVASTNLFR